MLLINNNQSQLLRQANTVLQLQRRLKDDPSCRTNSEIVNACLLHVLVIYGLLATFAANWQPAMAAQLLSTQYPEAYKTDWGRLHVGHLDDGRVLQYSLQCLDVP